MKSFSWKSGPSSAEKRKSVEKHILGVFHQVLARDKTRKVEISDNLFGSRVRVTTDVGDMLEVSCHAGTEHITVRCDHVNHSDPNNEFLDRISFFEFRCERNKFPKFRQQALILSKKIQMMSIHQVMDS